MQPNITESSPEGRRIVAEGRWNVAWQQGLA
jgi:hypothetical protein